MTRAPDAKEPFAALVFKTFTDPHVGKLSLMPGEPLVTIDLVIAEADPEGGVGRRSATRSRDRRPLPRS